MTAGAANPQGSVFWLASYPKSGNTWMRVLLTNLLRPGQRPASINDLLPGAPAFSRAAFDELVGLPSSDLTPDKLLLYLPLFRELLAEKCARPTFAKVHDACLRNADGALLFPPRGSAGAICIVRNPLDVAVSFAHHSQQSIDRKIAHMNDPAFALTPSVRDIRTALPQPLSTWSGHVTSWLDQKEIPLHVVRYEDMHADPVAALGGVARFAGLEHDADSLARAVERSRFERLRAEEERDGFRERMPVTPSFFREGRTGAWRDALSAKQVQAVVDAHAPTMERLGYLQEAEAFLEGGDSEGEDGRDEEMPRPAGGGGCKPYEFEKENVTRHKGNAP